MKNIKSQTWFSAGCLLGCTLMLLVGGAAPPKYVAGSGSEGMLPRWTASGTISDSGFFQIRTNRMALGLTNHPFLVHDTVRRVTGIGTRVMTNYDETAVLDATAVGYQALKNLRTGLLITAVGDDALAANTSGNQNTAVGSQALFVSEAVNNQTAVGFQALASVVTGDDNTAVGARAGPALTGQDNTLIGKQAGEALEQGDKNVAVGFRADVLGGGGINGSNVVIGADTFVNDQSTIVGQGASGGSSSRYLALVGNGANAGNFTNAGGFGWNSMAFADNMLRIGNTLTEKTVTSGRVEATNSFASYSTLATNQIPTTGWTNNAAINVTVLTTATAVSFTINNRAGTVLYTSPTLTATVPVNLQPGWSVRAASGLTGTVLPF